MRARVGVAAPRHRLVRPSLRRHLGTCTDQDRLVAAILRLGTTLGLETVAEGIELEARRHRLRQLMRRYGQGYLYSRPVPADELDAVLAGSLAA